MTDAGRGPSFEMPERLRDGLTPEMIEAVKDPTDDLAQQAREGMRGRTSSRSVEQDSRGEWHWFCLRDGCNWSGMGLLSEDGANREADRHDKEFHP